MSESATLKIDFFGCGHINKPLTWDDAARSVRCTYCNKLVHFDGTVKTALHNIHLVTGLPMTDAKIVDGAA